MHLPYTLHALRPCFNQYLLLVTPKGLARLFIHRDCTEEYYATKTNRVANHTLNAATNVTPSQHSHIPSCDDDSHSHFSCLFASRSQNLTSFPHSCLRFLWYALFLASSQSRSILLSILVSRTPLLSSSIKSPIQDTLIPHEPVSLCPRD